MSQVSGTIVEIYKREINRSVDVVSTNTDGWMSLRSSKKIMNKYVASGIQLRKTDQILHGLDVELYIPINGSVYKNSYVMTDSSIAYIVSHCNSNSSIELTINSSVENINAAIDKFNCDLIPASIIITDIPMSTLSVGVRINARCMGVDNDKTIFEKYTEQSPHN